SLLILLSMCSTLFPYTTLFRSVFALNDAFDLGVLSSRIHVVFSNRMGGWLGVGNDSTYNHSDCFEPFPWPLAASSERGRVRSLGDRKSTRLNSSHVKISYAVFC